MKTGAVVFLGLLYTAFGLDSMAGRGRVATANFEVIKTLDETMVYYLKRIQDNKSNCTVDASETSHNVMKMRYPNREIDRIGNVYHIKQNGQTSTQKVCEGGKRTVNLEHDIITLTHNVCRFSTMFCEIQSQTTFWDNNTYSKVIARGQVDILFLSLQPLVKLLVFKEINGMFILQLLKKIKNDKNDEVWVTNVNGLQAREIPASSTAQNFSHLGQYLNHSDFLNINNESIGIEGRAPQILSLEQMVSYTFILLVILVASYFLERFFGVIINCIILSRTRNRGCSALCLSQNMMNNHLYRYYTDEVSKTSNGVFGINGDSENRTLSSDIRMNVYNKEFSGFYE